MAALVVLKDGTQIEEIGISRPGEYSLGRQADLASIVIDHPSTSRKHATLTVDVFADCLVEREETPDLKDADGAVAAPERRRLFREARATCGVILRFDSTNTRCLCHASMSYLAV